MGCNCRSSKNQQVFIKEPDKLSHTQNGDEFLQNFNNWTKSLSHLFFILIDETNIMEEISFCKEPNELCLYIRVNSLIFWRSANMNLKNCLDKTSMGSIQVLVPTLLMMHS